MGFKVALIDKGDINNATSHNSLKTIHGGIRYLQHFNFKRTIESIREQSIWLKTASHLVKPLPFLMPTYGWGMRGPLAMYIGIRMFEAIGFLLGRNKGIDESSRVPRGQIISPKRCLERAPGIKKENLTAGAIWYDAQVSYADKAVFQICQDAVDNGAIIANYVKAQEVTVTSNRIETVRVHDLLGEKSFDIKAKHVINAAGPWVDELFTADGLSGEEHCSMALTKSMNLVTTLDAPDYAVSVQSKIQSDSKVDRSKRLYFIVPWNGKAMLGTTHFEFSGGADELAYEQREVEDFIFEMNQAYPEYTLSIDDVSYCYQGLTPAEKNEKGGSHRAHHSEFLQLQGEALRLEIKRHIDHTLLNSLVDMFTRRTDEFVRGMINAQQVRDASNVLAQELQWSQQRRDTELARFLSIWMPAKIKAELQQTPFWNE